MKTLTKEEVSKALAEAIVKAMENVNFSKGGASCDYWKQSDFESVYGYGVTVRMETLNSMSYKMVYEQKIIFSLYKYDGSYKKMTSISVDSSTWKDMGELSVYGRVAPVVDFFMTFIGKIEVEEDNNKVEYAEG